MKRSDFRFLDDVNVRWAELDQQKIVFNGHYLLYMDTAITGYWRAMALPYHETFEHLGGELYVRKATLEYQGSAEMGDRLAVGVRCARIGNSSMNFEMGVLRGDELLVRGDLVYVFADPVAKRALPLPQPLRELLLGFEAGEPMFHLRLGTWQEHGREAQTLRRSVFVQEQGLDAGLDHDDDDTTAVHALVLNRLGLALATARLIGHSPGTAQLGRVAVLRPMRGSGLGRAMVEALAGAARARGDSRLLVHARTDAVDFFAGAGFVLQGEPFHVAGVTHREMLRRL